MAQLISVHRDHDGEEIVLNADHIIFAERVASGKPAYTNLTLTTDTRITVRETFDELRSLIGPKA
jgi:Flagellar and Swarming motility proteins